MPHTHHLKQETHSDFLKQGRIDPITGEKIEEGHTIVICAACKSAFFVESWEYLGETHCNQTDTLSEIPVRKSLQLMAKPLEYLPFYFKKGQYILDRGDGSDTGFAAITLLLILGAIVTVPLVITIAVFLGSIFAWPVGWAFIGVSGYLINEIIQPYYRGKRKFSKITAKKGFQLAVNMKNQTVEYMRKNKKISIPFDDIKHIKYYIDYIPFSECGQYLQQSVSLEIMTKEYKKTRLYTFLHNNQIPQWSQFLEDLPYHLPVLNQK
ncbi:hypothetical protein [Bernardetia sp.]|uniref:hypothetical protein n=1 Tax=Bernardetia sp. TaxID=1937974 RepID=UPI0025BDB389|nr:hypothetical protein [Bernardetia sp.]